MTRRTIPFALLALAFAALFARLGFWQLDRLHERRARNRVTVARLAEPPGDIASVLADSGQLGDRRAAARGTFDYAHEMVLTSRTHNGSPGVNIITPLRIAGRDTAILVNRGWVYSPDGFSADLPSWREPEATTVDGYLVSLAVGGPALFRTPSNARAVRRLLRDSLAAALPYPIAPYYLVATSPAAVRGDSAPVRLATPAVDEGPHESYALQWFSFALIAVAGAALVVVQATRGGATRDGATRS